jgi:hypothetical protein
MAGRICRPATTKTEAVMSITVKSLFAFGLLTIVAACAQQEEVVFVEPEPIMEEPTSNKY